MKNMEKKEYESILEFDNSQKKKSYISKSNITSDGSILLLPVKIQNNIILTWNPDLETLLRFLDDWLENNGIDETVKFISDAENIDRISMSLSNKNDGITPHTVSAHEIVNKTIKSCIDKLYKLNTCQISLEKYHKKSIIDNKKEITSDWSLDDMI